MRGVLVLGPVAVEGDGDGDASALTSPSQRLLLAVLAAARPDAVPRHRLVDALWPEDPPPSALNSLGSHLSRLRHVLGPGSITRDGASYGLATATDADDFVRAVEGGDGDDPALAGELRAVLARWRGPAFGELADHPLVLPTARRLEGLRLRTRLDLARGRLAAGDAAGVAAELEAIVADEPLDEAAAALLVRALDRAGRRAEALRAAHRARRRLAEVGLADSADLHRAEQEVLAGGEPPPGTRGQAAVAGLPQYGTPPIGREDELDRLGGQLAQGCWVSLLGPGGVGKTRLAAAAASAWTERHGAPCVFVDLSAATGESDVSLAVARALGVDLSPPHAERVAEACTGRHLLILLDECERCRSGVVTLARRALLGGSVTVLATSRQPIGLDGEHLVEVGPLSPSAAAELFSDRVAAGGGRAEDPASVRRACALVDQLPLAIEMAAPLLRTLTMAQLIERLAQPLDLLDGDGGAAHPALRSTVRRSLELLGEQEVTVYRRLSLFEAPFTLERAEAVVGWGDVSPTRVASLVASLRDRSLLSPVQTPEGRRLRMLTTVRAHARELLAGSGEATAAADRHRRVYAELAVAVREGLAGRDATRWATVTELELADFEAAGRDDPQGTIAASMFPFVYDRLRPDVAAWAGARLDDGRPLAAAVRAELLAVRALEAFQNGDLAAARREAESASTPAGALHQWARIVLANVGLATGDLAAARDHAAAAAAEARKAGDPHAECVGLVLAGLAAGYGGDPAATDRAAEARSEVERTGAPPLLVYADYLDAELLAERDPDRALEKLDRALARARDAGSALGEGVALLTETTIRARRGSPETAVPAFLRTIRHWRSRADWTRQWTTLRNFACLLARIGEDDRCARLLGALEQRAPAPYGPERDRLDEARRLVADRLGADRFAALLAEGGATPDEEIVELCLAVEPA